MPTDTEVLQAVERNVAAALAAVTDIEFRSDLEKTRLGGDVPIDRLRAMSVHVDQLRAAMVAQIGALQEVTRKANSLMIELTDYKHRAQGRPVYHIPPPPSQRSEVDYWP